MSTDTKEPKSDVLNVRNGKDKDDNEKQTKKELVDSERDLNSKEVKEERVEKDKPIFKKGMSQKKTKFFEIFTGLITTNSSYNTHSLALFSNSIALICFSFYLLDLAKRDASVISVEILFGGFIQTICGFIAVTYGQPLIGYSSVATGNFWLTYAYINIWTYMFASVKKPSKHSLGVFSLSFSVVYIFIFISSLQKSLIMKRIYYLLMLIFQILFTIGTWVEKKIIMQISGGFCLASGLLSFYVSLAMMINVIHRAETMPLK